MYWVVSNIEMKYAGLKRYKGEVFQLQGARGDDNLVKVRHVALYDMANDEGLLVVDDTGRRFTSEEARRAFRIHEPNAAKVVVVNTATMTPVETVPEPEKRRPGRPKGSKDSQPRKRTIDRAVGVTTAADVLS